MLWPSVWCRQSTVPYSDGKYYAAQIHLCSHGGPGQGDYLLCRGWNGFSGGAEPAEVSNHYIHLDSHTCVCICFPYIILFIGTCRIAEVSDYQIHFHLVLVYCIFHLQSHSCTDKKFMLWINTFAFIIAILFPVSSHRKLSYLSTHCPLAAQTGVLEIHKCQKLSNLYCGSNLYKNGKVLQIDKCVIKSTSTQGSSYISI